MPLIQRLVAKDWTTTDLVSATWEFPFIFKFLIALGFTENIYDQIPNEQFYDAPYEMRTNDEVYEPEPVASNVITINGISVR